ncbi:MAG: hypothetical protein KAV87_60295 [Desulfobacteraceae bacterium]|nr:hypothetical protein [Desulfobacteraceae bacterium]
MNIRKKYKRINKLKIKWFQTQLAHWFELNNRKFPWRERNCSKYQLIIAEVLLQRTKAETIAIFFPFFIKQYPSWKSLSSVNKTRLKKDLKPIGLWKRRSDTLKRLSTAMAKRGGRFPRTRGEIEELPGVGQYIANAILMFCQDEPQPLLDMNMARVLERFFGSRKLADIRYDPYLQKLAREVLPRKRYKEFNWAILDFASLICKARKPLCLKCPLKIRCRYFRK